MKKAVLILLALLMVASLATAQGVKIGAWGRGFVYVAGTTAADSKVQLSSNAIGWYVPGGPRIGINIIGSSENVGFQIDLNGDGGINLGDQSKIWVKPISMLTVQVGYSCYDDALRGNASFGMYNWLRMDGMPGDDFIFQRVATNFELALDPMEGLHIFYAQDGKGNAEDVVKFGQAGAGYTIPGIGMLRAQWLGTATNAGEVDAAFKLTAVSGLTVDLGAAITMVDKEMPLTNINLFASYAVMPTLTLNAIAGLGLVNLPQILNDLGIKDYMRWYFGIEGEYALPGDMVITVDVRVKSTTNDNAAIITDNNKLYYGALLAIQKNFSNGLIGLGVEVTNSVFAGGAGVTGGAAADGSTIQFAVPIRVEYWF